MCLEYLEYASKRNPKWRGAEVSQPGTSRETPLPNNVKSSCEEILTSDSRESVSDASSMIQTFRTFFMGWVENSKRPSNRQLANWLRRRWPRASSKVSSLEEAMTSSISTNAVFSWRNVAWPCHDLARSPHQLGKFGYPFQLWLQGSVSYSVKTFLGFLGLFQRFEITRRGTGL